MEATTRNRDLAHRVSQLAEEHLGDLDAKCVELAIGVAVQCYQGTDLTDALETLECYFAAAKKVMSCEKALSFLTAMGVDGLATGAIVFSFYFELGEPLFTWDEFAENIQDFLDQQRVNKQHLIATGFPQTPGSRRGKWLASRLGLLLPTKFPYLRRPVKAPGSETVSFDYLWERYQENDTGFDEHMVCDYRDADHLLENDQDALRVESMREKVFDLKIAVLEVLSDALKRRSNHDLWERCLNELTSRLRLEEAEFLLRIDREMFGYDVVRDESEGFDDRYYTGGLTNLFMVIGWIEVELASGKVHRLCRALRTVQPPPRQRVTTVGRSDTLWYEYLSGSDVREVQELVTGFKESLERESVLWDQYRHRVTEALAERFHREAAIRIDAPAGEFKEYREHVEAAVEFIWAHFKATGAWPEILGASATVGRAVEGPAAKNYLVRDAVGWRMRFRGGNELQIKHVMGFLLIAYVLDHPYKVYQPKELWAAAIPGAAESQAFPGKATAYEFSRQDGVQFDGQRPMAASRKDPKIESLEECIELLSDQVKEAERNNDAGTTPDLREALHDYKEQLAERRRKARRWEHSDPENRKALERIKKNITL